MFIGHFAVGFALKRAAPATNLGWLIAAVCFLDLLWPFFLIAGLEQVEIDPGNTAFTPLNFVSYPYTHSLASAAAWSLLFAGVYYAISKYKAGAIAVGVGVVSHWFLDAVVHRPDLPLYPGGTERIGLELWNSVPAAFVVESLMFAIGVWLYIGSTRAKDKTGTILLWGFVALLVISYIANILSPPPPSAAAVAYFAPLVWIYVALAIWTDRHRTTDR